MNAALAAVSSSSVSASLLLPLLGSSLKGSVVFGVVYLATRLMHGSHPSLRHLLWLGVIGSYPLILLLTLVSPPLLPMRPLASSAKGTLYATMSSLLRPAGVMPAFRSAAAAAAQSRASPVQALWSFALLLWGAGIAANLVPVAAGNLRARRLVAEALGRDGRDSAMPALARELGARLNIARLVRVVQSPACRVPFAAGVLRPVLVLPSGAGAWPAGRLRAVMLHELGHIRRGDCLSQVAARCICALFWFVPLVWIAYWFLHVEQEKACDAGALRNGVSPTVYASCLLLVAQRCVRPAAFAGLLPPHWRKRMLDGRIRHIVTAKPSAAPSWPALAASVLVLCAMVLLGGARWKRPLSDEEAYQRFVGTWVNTHYPGTLPRSQVTVVRPDCVGEDWLFPDSPSPGGQWTIKVKRTWVDEKGNIYCQFYGSYIKGTKYRGAALMRVDNKGAIWEINARKAKEDDASRYLEQIDPHLQAYWIYYRKE